MPAKGYLTPETIPVDTICRALYIPDAPEIRWAVYGALLELTYPHNWELYGAITPDEIAYEMLLRVLDFMDGECVMPPTVDLFTDQKAQGVAGGGLTANTEATILFATPDAANEGNVTYTAGVFTFIPGVYLIDIWHVARAAAAVNQTCYWRHNTVGQIYKEGLHLTSPTNVQGILRLKYILVADGTIAYRFCIMQSVTRATDALGVASNYAGRVEVYGEACFTRLGDTP